jgi:hypothetical protein
MTALSHSSWVGWNREPKAQKSTTKAGSQGFRASFQKLHTRFESRPGDCAATANGLTVFQESEIVPATVITLMITPTLLCALSFDEPGAGLPHAGIGKEVVG